GGQDEARRLDLFQVFFPDHLDAEQDVPDQPGTGNDNRIQHDYSPTRSLMICFMAARLWARSMAEVSSRTASAARRRGAAARPLSCSSRCLTSASTAS